MSAYQDAIRLTEEYMEDIMKRYDPSHDVHHVRRVRKTALALANAQTSKVDLFVVEMASLLHDILDRKYLPKGQPTPETYAFFEPFFRKVEEETGMEFISSGQASLIARVVDNVSWTNETKLKTNGLWTEWHDSCLELHCVQDADRLDSIGAFGIMRVSAYSAKVNRALHIPMSDRSGIPREPGMEHESAIDHFDYKLLHVKERLKTSMGKKLGEKRHATMLEFLKAIEEEEMGGLV
ncbi:hypothetical protein DL96DRAFT_830548 [Flagelloscypha sp. PMI_526]|nr:hypothetical protein DL96DRAFT_830548 [Flagelloscypha sp. PMI_526]